ncbi:hypothetical protein NKR23_g2100 [Pleurostoma richardsiae]|uniref:Uncharacterized protein n=1 Tax=Pleurostoma richardsiae TaxID=41990 RepID=A0AA38VYL9_9PEZI|nr:hypothetical protein NKR23_g2100 [Pleurostoma richardsiae]
MDAGLEQSEAAAPVASKATQLPAHSASKAPRLPSGACKLTAIATLGYKIQKRPLNRRVRAPGSNSNIVYVGTRSPFIGIVKSVRKALENSPAGVRGQSTKGLPLNARIAALSAGGSARGGGGDESGEGSPEVLVRGTGAAIEKTLHVAAWFNRQSEYKVALRTLSESTVDDVVKEGGDEDEGGFAGEEDSRMRMLSCLELGIRLR